jgi:hypothetical protein
MSPECSVDNTRVLDVDIIIQQLKPCKHPEDDSFFDRVIKAILFKPDGTMWITMIIRPMVNGVRPFQYTGDADTHTFKYEPNIVLPSQMVDRLKACVELFKSARDSPCYQWDGNILVEVIQS